MAPGMADAATSFSKRSAIPTRRLGDNPRPRICRRDGFHPRDLRFLVDSSGIRRCGGSALTRLVKFTLLLVDRALRPEDDHLLLGHFPHRPGDAADAVAGLAAAGEGHPVGAEGRVVINHYGR